jgi:hypothetical protein
VRISYGEKVAWWFQEGRTPNELVGIPDPFTATVDDGSLPYDVDLVIVGDTETETHQIEAVTIRRRVGGPAVTADALRRIPVGALRITAIEQAATLWVTTTNDDGTVTAKRLDPHYTKPTGWKMPPAPPRQQSNRATNGPRSNAIDPATITKAVELYEQAKQAGQRDAFAWVGEQLGVARSTAHKYVNMGRKNRGKR